MSIFEISFEEFCNGASIHLYEKTRIIADSEKEAMEKFHDGEGVASIEDYEFDGDFDLLYGTPKVTAIYEDENNLAV